MAILEIYTFPDPILRKQTKAVTVFDHELETTTQSMLETMYVSSGIGLAAIQAGILKQIIVVDLKSGEEDITQREPHVFINPKIVKQSGTTVSEEGCLSVIEFRGEIQRAEKIIVEYQDVTGKLQKMEGREMDTEIWQSAFKYAILSARDLAGNRVMAVAISGLSRETTDFHQGLD